MEEARQFCFEINWPLVDEKKSFWQRFTCMFVTFLHGRRPAFNGHFWLPHFSGWIFIEVSNKKLNFCLQKLSKTETSVFFHLFSFLNFSRVEFCYSLGRVLRFSFQKREIIFSKTAKLLFQKSLQFKNISYMHFFCSHCLEIWIQQKYSIKHKVRFDTSKNFKNWNIMVRKYCHFG